MGKSDKVFVAVSGGVDSATTAAILCKKGYDCFGVFMITHDDAKPAQQDAQKVCDTLGIHLHVLDFRKHFQTLINYFIDEYKQARTPNPCVLCNRIMKFGHLWAYAKANGAVCIATGHYARIDDTSQGPGLFQAHNPRKDQSYVLSMINRETLGHIIFPMSELDKEQTRKLASEFGLHIDAKQDSQEICFIPDNDYARMLLAYCPEAQKIGHVVDKSGRILGQHEGIFRYTIGQRRGLGIAMGQAAYVIGLNAQNNTIILGSKEDLLSASVTAKTVNWLIDIPNKPFEAIVKIRYNHSGQSAQVNPVGTDCVEIKFDKPVSAATPGQAAVMYINTPKGLQVIGGGWIDKAG